MELSKYQKKQSENERLISIIFVSFDESIEYPIFCKNTEDFIFLEQLFYKKYPEYKNKVINFYVNGVEVNRKMNLINNKIYDGAKLLFKYKDI